MVYAALFSYLKISQSANYCAHMIAIARDYRIV